MARRALVGWGVLAACAACAACAAFGASDSPSPPAGDAGAVAPTDEGGAPTGGEGGSPGTDGAVGDSGADADADAKAEKIPSGGKLVFVTKTAFKPGQTLTGVTQADMACNADAMLAGRSGKFVAWLSANGANAGDRLGTGPGRTWYLRDGNRVATEITLFSGVLAHAIDKLATGDPAPSPNQVWTGTHRTGTAGMTCGSWTTAFGSGSAGDHTLASTQWTETIGDNLCSTALPIYCFEQ